MKRKRVSTLTALVVALAALLAPMQGWAIPPQYASGSTCPMVIPFHISGQYTATTAGIVKFNMPVPVTLDAVQVNARASGGTAPTLTVNVLKGGTTVLSAQMAITAGTVREALASGTTETITTQAFAAGDATTVDFTIGGTTPTWNDVTVVLYLCRKGG